MPTPILSSYLTTVPKKVKKAKKSRKGHDYSIEEPQVLDPSKFEVKSETVKSTSRFCAPEPRWVQQAYVLKGEAGGGACPPQILADQKVPPYFKPPRFLDFDTCPSYNK